MPIYRVHLFFGQFNKGWTETYYRESSSARAATFFDPLVLADMLSWRAESVVLDAIRAQEVDGLRRIYLRKYGNGEIISDPVSDRSDVTQTSAYCWLPFKGGEGRPLYIRGLHDSAISRFREGQDHPGAELVEGLTLLSQSIRFMGLLGRRKVKTHVKTPIDSIAPSPDDPRTTIITVLGPHNFASGQYIHVLGKPILGMPPERPYLILSVDGQSLTVAYDRPPTLKTMEYPAGHFIRRLEYDYPPLEDVEFRSFSKHKTGPRYRMVSWSPVGNVKTPLNPCGRGVDMLPDTKRSGCYTVPMALWRDDPALTTLVRWYFLPRNGEEDLPTLRINNAEPERGTIPYDHPYGSRVWELNSDYPPIIGETAENRQWCNGEPPVELYGVGLCGTVDQWSNGCYTRDVTRPVNPTTGEPCCCGPGRIHEVATNLSYGEIAVGPFPPVCGFWFEEPTTVNIRITISGCTGTKSGFNGVWEGPYSSACAWEIFVPAVSDYIYCFACPDCVPPNMWCLVGLDGDDGEYQSPSNPDVSAPITLSKTVGGVLFPSAISIEFF